PSSGLGQLHDWQGRYREATAYLSRAASIDSYAQLFLGWSRLLEGLNLSDDAEVKTGLNDLVEALREWCYQKGDRAARSSWLRQVHKLARLGGDFAEDATHLIVLANSYAIRGRNDHYSLICPVT